MKNLIKRVNEIACGDDGWALGGCKESLAPSKNYAMDLAVAVLIQYVLPGIFLAVIFSVIYNTLVVFSFIDVLCGFNPLFALLYLPLYAVDGWIAAFVIISAIIITVVYTAFYYKRLGAFSFIPIVAWIAAIVLWLVPLVGPILSAMVAIFPWIPAMTILHWWIYSD